uniref:GAG-pre-integrase domain-containing protein n=1 Tax=Cajanus cajan TaxID=3821 RepID=A0A151SKG9_CAJCA|nr:hypothetical protein KK1_001548 [Cajanus cajan]
MIGSAKMHDSLYIFRVPSYQNSQYIKPSTHVVKAVNFVSTDLETLWHFRLGHTSNKCVDVIKFFFPLF